MPRVYYFGTPGAPLVTIIAGTHGNEPAPALYLKEYVRRAVEFPPGYMFAIVPVVNERAFEAGVRSTARQTDVNRLWPGGPINSYLLPLVAASSLVVDFHESFGFSACQTPLGGVTLGQTIYTNNSALVPLVDTVIDTLNSRVDGCMSWQRLDALPPIGGTLDEYCTEIGKPYILIEMAGQRDIVPLPVRFAQMQILLGEILGLP